MSIAAADFQQAKAWPRTSDFVQQVVELAFDALFQRRIAGLVFPIGEITNAYRFGSMHEGVAQLDQLDWRHMRGRSVKRRQRWKSRSLGEGANSAFS